MAPCKYRQYYRSLGHIACTGDMRNACNILIRKPKRKNHSEDQGVDGKALLEWIFRWEDVDWIYLAWDRDQ
jgi:hypothetical protein